MTGVLDVRDVVVRFGGLTAVDKASLMCQPGAVTSLIGPNGAGKTTLFNVVSGVQRPTSGTVSLDGRDITGLPAHRRARLGLARTFQRLELFGSLTVYENLLVAAEIGKARRPRETASRLLDELGLDDVATALAAAVPTGTARLVEIARALATSPSVLLLDEPGSGLDETETKPLGQLLRRLAATDGLTVVLVEHDVELVMSVSDTVYALDLGRILASGTPSEVQRHPEVIASYLGVA